LERGQTTHSLEGHTNGIRAVGVTPDGHRAVSASDDHSLRLWDLDRGQEIATFTGEDDINSCAAASDGRTIVAGDALGRAHFLRLIEANKTKPKIGET
jgi:WD40 repeat protein